MNKGKLYLIPTIIGEDTQRSTLPSPILEAIKRINIFITENIRTSRRQIKKIYKAKNIDETIFYAIGKHNCLKLKQDFLPHILSGKDVGLLSEAGTPCIADPGSEIVAYAHKLQIDIIPLVGPSSILLALMASGLNGQKFAFNGYLPINKIERKNKIKELENLTRKTKQTQIFMETPYRNNQLLSTIFTTCNKNTRLCIASNITLENEKIRTKKIAEWKQEKVDIHKQPTIFLIG